MTPAELAFVVVASLMFLFSAVAVGAWLAVVVGVFRYLTAVRS